ncbi:MAG TPA: DUF481 domain-containing protein [Acidobacteriaceae bacterium]|nr:DUF481 domain-containing protein [Acidobacteriaceae bacterium]
MQQSLISRPVVYAFLVFALIGFAAGSLCRASAAPTGAAAAAAQARPAGGPDLLVLTNGDRLSGKFVRAVGGKVLFHDEILGDITVGWENVRELHTETKVAVLKKGIPVRRHTLPTNLPEGSAAIENGMVTVQPENNATIAPIPVADAEYIVDDAELRKQVYGRPSFTEGWNGGATVGVTVVQATQNQSSFAASLALVRVVPTASWLDPRNRTSFDYAQSYGKITQPSYTAADGTFVPSTSTKSSILHVGAERDQYVSSRAYYLGTVSFDHNYSQSLDLQQIYGVGVGYTAIKTPVQELDFKAVAQYERQAFANAVPPGSSDKNLIASTFGAAYLRHITKGILFTQQLLYIPAWNDLHAYSFNESNTLSLPVYKNFSFSLGTLDTYLNDVPLTFPTTQRNSFQFTTGVTYNIKSSY